MFRRFSLAIVGCGSAIAFRERQIPIPITSEEYLSTPLHSQATRWYRLIRPMVFLLQPETAHVWTINCGSFIGYVMHICVQFNSSVRCTINGFATLLVGPTRQKFETFESILHSKIGHLDFEIPIGISAGFDKNGKLFDFFTNQTLFGSAEIGSVSYLPWLGNPKPRIFRLVQDNAIINRMGLNNDGAVEVANRICDSHVGKSQTFVGVNITKTPSSEIFGNDAVDDFVNSFNFFKNMDHIHWITLNVSCPNTAEGKTFEDPIALTELLSSIEKERLGCRKRKLLFLKLAPVNSNWENKSIQLIRIAKQHGVDALVIANTLPPEGTRELRLKSNIEEKGGLSGPPIFGRSIPLIKLARSEGMPVIAAGGIASGKDAYRMFESGASLIQIYTAMVYDGPGIFSDIKNGLARIMLVNGIKRIADIPVR